jgi:hypothetical protein
MGWHSDNGLDSFLAGGQFESPRDIGNPEIFMVL